MSSIAIIIFGASGDLTSRKLIPALYRLDAAGQLPENAFVVGNVEEFLGFEFAFKTDCVQAHVEDIAKLVVHALRRDRAAWGRALGPLLATLPSLGLFAWSLAVEQKERAYFREVFGRDLLAEEA